MKCSGVKKEEKKSIFPSEQQWGIELYKLHYKYIKVVLQYTTWTNVTFHHRSDY